MKNPLTLAGFERATFRFVAQHLNHCATAVPRCRSASGLNFHVHLKRTRGREQNHVAQDRVQVTRFSPLVLMISLSVMCVKQIAFQTIFHNLFSNLEVKNSCLVSGESHFFLSCKT
jgi:hypothetical protein